VGAEARQELGAEAGRGMGRGHGCPGRGAGSRRVGEGKGVNCFPPLLERKVCPRLLYLLFISLMRLFPGSLITIIETIPFLTLFTAWKRKRL